MLKLLSESLNGWRIIKISLLVVIVLSLFNKTIGVWAGRIFVVMIALFFVLGILSFFIPFDKLFNR